VKEKEIVLFIECRVSIWDDEKVLEIYSNDYYYIQYYEYIYHH
jgi:hypothetical protein